MPLEQCDVIIIGGGAAGLMCAIEAGKRGRTVLILEHTSKVGRKILMSGGGRCNFTNYHINPDNYISHNKHFCKSALTRYTQWNFIELVKKHRIPFHEKTLGQLFCDSKSKDILDMLLRECNDVGATIHLNSTVTKIEKKNAFLIKTLSREFQCESLVIASGGLSIPTMGASSFGYKIAEQFGIKIWPTRAALVPFTLHFEDKKKYSPLSGIAVHSITTNQRQQFRENILFTHRGLSGPAILQISSYWQPGENIVIDMLPDIDLVEHLKISQKESPQKQLNSILSDLLPRRVVEVFFPEKFANRKLHSFSLQELKQLAASLKSWHLKPNGTEGYRTAEVTLGGVDCNFISSKTMETNTIPGLYFIGEVLDVTGWLGGFNFQWAWSSGWAAGQAV